MGLDRRRVCLRLLGVLCGPVDWPDDGRNSDDLLAHAEVALNIAKGSTGERALFFVPGMTDSMQERLALENDLRRALTSHEFELFYQPQISVRTGKIAAVEALLRWRHPSKGWIGPNSFISLAEETGLIIPLGEWVLREACRQARFWQTEFGVTFPVAVNLSATQFRHQNILQTVDRALTSAGLHPSERSVAGLPLLSAAIGRALPGDVGGSNRDAYRNCRRACGSRDSNR